MYIFLSLLKSEKVFCSNLASRMKTIELHFAMTSHNNALCVSYVEVKNGRKHFFMFDFCLLLLPKQSRAKKAFMLTIIQSRNLTEKVYGRQGRMRECHNIKGHRKS